MQRTRLYVDGQLRLPDVPTAELVATLKSKAGDDDTFAWIDLTTESAAVVDDLAQQLDLHALAVENALTPSQRPKLARFESHVLLTVSHASVADDGSVLLAPLTAVITPNLVVTVRDDAFPIGLVEERLDSNADLAAAGPSCVAWGLLDVVVDDHIAALESLDDVVEDLSRELFERSHDIVELQRRAFLVRRSISKLRHATLPLREVVTTLVRREATRVPQVMQPYFADVYDHALHAADWNETLRDQVASILETNVALQGNRMNLIMKKVTSWAAIIAVPTAITGFYGQNVGFPGFGTDWAFLVSSGIIVAAGGLLYAVFRRNDWL